MTSLTSAPLPPLQRLPAFRTLSLLILSVATFGCGSKNAKQADAAAEGAPSVRVAAASDLQFALKDVVAHYESTHPGKKVEVVFGSSGNLFAQLSNKAPYDIFLAADISYPRKLIEAGLAAADSEFSYAIGHLVVWVPKSSTLDFETQGIEALADPSVKVIAMANPQHAPYGRAAEAALKSLGAYDKIKDRLVLGENISQTSQFVESGAADAGLIALSLALAPAMQEKGRYWSLPADSYPRLEQGGVVLNAARDPAAAQELRTFITSDQGKEILRKYGFAMPGE